MRESTYSYFSVLLFALCMGAAGFTMVAFKSHISLEGPHPAAAEQSTLAPLTLDYHLLAADMAWQRKLWTQAAE
ncbi:MAG TPA: hypothetical protein VI522_08220, partial [Gammaproteobacteria bacterium]|nr:hypothetical protein [Gammaproteobacteria bacterium]